MPYNTRIQKYLQLCQSPIRVVTSKEVASVVESNLKKFDVQYSVIETVESQSQLLNTLQMKVPTLVVVPTNYRTDTVLEACCSDTTLFSEFFYWSFTDSFTPADFYPPKNWRDIFQTTSIKPNALSEFLQNTAYADNLYALRMTISSKYSIPELIAFETILETDFRRSMKRFQSTSFYENTVVYVQAGDIVIDCGACSSASGGQYVTQFAKTVGQSGQVIALEPIQSIYHELLEDVHNHSNVVAINAAVDRFRGEKTIIADGISSTLATVPLHLQTAEKPAESSLETIRTMPLNDFSEKVSFIKMDVEGSETPALQGALTVIQTHKPKLSICTYHSPEDFVSIPALINTAQPYEFYLECNEGKPWSGMKVLGTAKQ